MLNVIRCNYKILRKTPCGANNCSCRKIDLPCITANGNCHGNNYTHVAKFEIVDDSDDERLKGMPSNYLIFNDMYKC